MPPLHLLQNPQQRLLLPPVLTMLPTHRDPHTRRHQPQGGLAITQRNPAETLDYGFQLGGDGGNGGAVAGAEAGHGGVGDGEEDAGQFDVLDAGDVAVG